MAREELVASILRDLGSKLGLGDLQLDSQQRRTIRFGDISVTLLYEEQPAELLWLLARLGEVKPDDQELLDGALRLNMLSWLSGRMTIALDETGTSLVGHAAIPVSVLDLPLLQETLDHFLKCGRVAADRLARRDRDFEAVGAGVELW